MADQLTNRFLNISVLDRNQRPIPGARVIVSVGATQIAAATTKGSPGEPISFQTLDNVQSVGLLVEYQHRHRLLTRNLTVDLDQRNVPITFDEVEMPGPVPAWFAVAGYASGLLTLLYFMYIASQDVEATFAHVIVVALGVALAVSFLGGDAMAKGRLPLPLVKVAPISFSVGGGVAVFVIVTLLGRWVFLADRGVEPVSELTATFEEPVSLDTAIDVLRQRRHVTVRISPTCPANATQRLLPAGTYFGSSPEDYLDELLSRLDETFEHRVQAMGGGRRFEIVCEELGNAEERPSSIVRATEEPRGLAEPVFVTPEMIRHCETRGPDNGNGSCGASEVRLGGAVYTRGIVYTQPWPTTAVASFPAPDGARTLSFTVGNYWEGGDCGGQAPVMVRVLVDGRETWPAQPVDRVRSDSIPLGNDADTITLSGASSDGDPRCDDAVWTNVRFD